MEQTLSLSRLLELANKADLKKDSFSQEIFFFVTIYRCLIVRLAKEFSGSSLNVKATEYNFDEQGEKGKIREITIIIDFLGEHEMFDFGFFVSKCTSLIPEELRKMFDVAVGCQYGDEGGFIITEKDIKYISKEEFQAEETHGSLIDEINEHEAYTAMGRFRNLLLEEIKF